MLTASTSPTLTIKKQDKKYTLFAANKSANNLTVNGKDGVQILETKKAGDVAVVGECNDAKQVIINGKPSTSVISSTPSTVFKVFDGAAEKATANGQIMKGQIVKINVDGSISLASSNDETVIYSPLKIALGNAADGEELLIANIDKEFNTAIDLVAGKPVFLGVDGWVVPNQEGAFSIALGIATGTKKFHGRNGLRVRVLTQ